MATRKGRFQLAAEKRRGENMPKPVGFHIITDKANYAREYFITIEKHVPDDAWTGTATVTFSRHPAWGEFRVGKMDAALREMRLDPALPEMIERSEPIAIRVPNS